MAIASGFLGAVAFALDGTKHEHVSATTLATTGTVSESSDGDGDYISAASQPGNYLAAPIVTRAHRADGAIWLFSVKTTETGWKVFGGAVDGAGNNTIEYVGVNLQDPTGTVLNGCVMLYLKGNSNAHGLVVRTGNIGFNDGTLKTVAIKWIKASDNFEIWVNGVSQTVVKAWAGTSSTVLTTAGSMVRPYNVLCRNDNGVQGQNTLAKLYALARLNSSDFDAEALSNDPHQIIAADGALDAAAAGTATASGSADASVDGPVVLDATASGAAVASGTADADLTTPTIVSEPLYDNVPNLLADEPLTYVAVYHPTTGALVVRKTGLSTGADGRYSFTDPALAMGIDYLHDWLTASGHRRMPVKAAA